MGGLLILIISYASIAAFLGAIAYRFWKISSLPMHLRWELYPVAHEKGKAHYGGSYLEEPEWWSKKRESSLLGELKVMIPEILLLAGVWEHNRRHWFRSFPFHFGLYMLAGLIGLLIIGGIAAAAGANISADGGPLGMALYHATYIVGYVGLGLSLYGTLALLARRVLNEDYREYTKKADFFNLAFFAATFRLLTFNFTAAGEWLPAPQCAIGAEIILGSLLLAYIPMTHMSHFFTKWFMYHDIRWSDEPNLAGGKFEKQIAEALQYPVSWSAPHIRGDGKKTWADVATSDVEEEEEK